MNALHINVCALKKLSLNPSCSVRPKINRRMPGSLVFHTHTSSTPTPHTRLAGTGPGGKCEGVTVSVRVELKYRIIKT